VIDVTVSAVVQAWDLGPGESAVLAWAHQHPGNEVILDDLTACRCVLVLNASVRCTLGLALLAK
jgi:predicted nucleic acid-binding protein